MKRSLLAILASGILASMACGVLSDVLPPSIGGGQGDSPDAPVASDRPEPNSLVVEAVTEAEAAATAWLWPDEALQLTVTGADGTDYEIEFPVGAVLSPVQVVMTPVTRLEGLPVGVENVHAVNLQPEGLNLVKPATLTIRPSSSAEGFVGFSTYAEGRDFHLSPTLSNGDDIVMTVMHFSDPGITRAGQDVLQDIQVRYSPIEMAAYYQNEIVLALSAETAEERATILIGEFRSWYLDIEPTLEASQTDPDVLDDAIRQYLQFENWFDIIVNASDDAFLDLMTSEIYDYLEAARGFLANGIWNGINVASEKCISDEDPDEAVRALRWAAAAGALSLWNLDNANDPRKLNPRDIYVPVSRCMEFDVDFDSDVVMSGEGTYEHGTGARIDVFLEFERFESRAFEQGQLLLDYNDETLDYEVFEVTGLPAGCTTDKGDGGIDVQVYFGLNYYDYPPRLDDYVLLLFRVDPEPFEIINCQNASLPQTNLWHDVLRILHRDEVHSSKNALLLTMQIIRQNDSYARYHSNRNLSELQELMEAGEAPLLPVSAFDTVREVMLINLIHTPRPAGG